MDSYTAAEIMRQANKLIEMLDDCNDLDLVDEVTAAVSCNDPFTEDRVAEVS